VGAALGTRVGAVVGDKVGPGVGAVVGVAEGKVLGIGVGQLVAPTKVEDAQAEQLVAPPVEYVPAAQM
jgi:uncharacterized protein YcfJ